MTDLDLIVIGAGPAGLAAALEARKSGIEKILILEREEEAGGILQQCIHNGFGLHLFGEELTGPEYACRFIQATQEAGIEIKLNTMVLSLNQERVSCETERTPPGRPEIRSPDSLSLCHLITCVNQTDGLVTYRSLAVILAMGCRERSRGALNIPGSRPAGIFTAGAAQRFVNLEGAMPGTRIVILGSGDIGLIMARRLTLEGAQVLMVCEIMPYSGGLNRNIVQCLRDYGIPLLLSHTVVQIHGRDRLESVTIAKVDENRKPIPETFETIACDTLLLSVGLIPENELTLEAGIKLDPVTGGPEVSTARETSVQGVFACGNVVHVHDLVDYVSEEGCIAGQGAAQYLKGFTSKGASVQLKAGRGVRYVVPQGMALDSFQEPVTLFFRVDAPYDHCKLAVIADGMVVETKRKQKMTPGEMEHVILSKEKLNQIKTVKELVLEVN